MIQQYCAAGLNYGYYYDRSPTIIYDSESAPDYSMSQYNPSTVPGCRVPHFRLDDGSSLYDNFGPVFTLLRCDPDADASGFATAAEVQGLPLKILDVTPPAKVADLYRHQLVLVRPDQHVAWRGNAASVDPGKIIATARGASANA